jgi:hypothetical protein
MQQEVKIDDNPARPHPEDHKENPVHRQNPNRPFPWHNDYLPAERKGFLLGEKLTTIRNHAIFALYVQFISTIAGFSLFIARRVI